MHNYESTYKGFPASRVNISSPDFEAGWQVMLLPFIEQAGLFETYRTDLNWSHPSNLPATETTVQQFLCPSAIAPRTMPGAAILAERDITWTPNFGSSDYAAINNIRRSCWTTNGGEMPGQIQRQAQTKRIFLADIRGASDVSSVESLPSDKDHLLDNEDSVRLVQKRLLINLLDWRDELGDAAAAEKPEGLAWGKPLRDGRRTLWICWDNDFDPQRQSYVACFAVDLN